MSNVIDMPKPPPPPPPSELEYLRRLADDLAARLVTANEQTERAIANTDRAIAQTTAAIEQAQRYLDMFKEERAKRLDAAREPSE